MTTEILTRLLTAMTETRAIGLRNVRTCVNLGADKTVIAKMLQTVKETDEQIKEIKAAILQQDAT